MAGRREQVWVGTFVLVAAAALIAIVLAVSGAFARKGIEHRTYFKFVSGLAKAAPVRFGGLDAGRVEKLRVDPGNSTLIEIQLSVAPDIPVKLDSVAKISFVGALGEPYLEITSGSRNSPLAQPGSILKSQEFVGISDLTEAIGALAPIANRVLASLDDRLTEIKVTIAQANDLLGEQNRNSIRASLASMQALLAENRPHLKATLSNMEKATDKFPQVATNVQIATERLTPVLEDLKTTLRQAQQTLATVDTIAAENRPDVRASMVSVRKILDTATQLVEMLDKTLDRNADNLEEAIANVRETTTNMQELTDSLKRKPSLLIRGETGKDRKPGDKH